MKQAGVLPKLKLGLKEEGKAPISTGAHRVKIIEDKIQKAKDEQGNVIEVVKYILEENGEKKFYQVPVKNKQGELHYLVQRLSEIPEGQEIILKMKKRGVKNYISVAVVGEPTEIEDDQEDLQEEPPTQGAVPTSVDYPEEDAEPDFDPK